MIRGETTHLIDFLLNSEGDRVVDVLGVSLDDLLDLLLFKILELVLLEVKADLATTAEGFVGLIEADGELATSGRLPDVLLVVVVLGDDLNALGDEIGRVETDTELTDHGHVGTSVKGL